jgi:hypothetical protein
MCTPHYIERYCQSTKRRYSQSAKIKELARACNIPYTGWISNIGRDRLTCSRLITYKPPNVDYIPISSHIHNFLVHIIGMPETKSSLDKYAGYPEAGILGLLYLIQINRNVCAIFPALSELTTLVLNATDKTLENIKIPWEMAGLYWKWNHVENKFKFHRFSEEIYKRDARACKHRFILSLLTLHTKTHHGHANIIIYDKETHILERFDPYEVYAENIDSENLDLQLQDLYKQIDPQFLEYIAPPNIHFFEKFGLQLEQKSETLDPTGFCQPWTFIYAQLRISFPYLVPETIPRLLKQWVREQNQQLTILIRNYSQFLMETSQVIFVNGIKNNFLNNYTDPRVGYMGLCLKQLSQQF